MSARIQIERREISDNLIVVSLQGRLDIHSMEYFRETLNSESTHQNYNIILDMSSVTFIISTYVGLILSFQKNAKKHGGCLTLAGLNSDVGSIFELMGITDFVSIHPTLEAAIESFQLS